MTPPFFELLPPRIVLASGSPRRRQLLQDAGVPFILRVPGLEEVYPREMPLEEVPAHLAAAKAEAARHPEEAAELILAADTVVLLGGELLGKPRDAEEAKAMLRRLSGRMHRVITGVCLLGAGGRTVFSEETRVYFRALGQDQIDFYVDRYAPLDKAGAYAIQEWIGLAGVERIEGDYFNVMGLPVGRVLEALRAC